MTQDTYLHSLNARPKITEQLSFDEWLELAAHRRMATLVITFAKTSGDLLLPDESGTAAVTLTELTQLSRDINALRARPSSSLNTLVDHGDADAAKRSSMDAIVRARLSNVAAARFMALFDRTAIIYEQVRNCVNGKFAEIPNDMKEALLNYNEATAICTQDVLADLYTEAQLTDARQQYLDAQIFLDNLVPTFVGAFCKMPSHPSITSQLKDVEDDEKTLKLWSFGRGLMTRFATALQMLPDNVISQQVQSMREASTRPEYWDAIKAYTYAENPPNVFMHMFHSILHEMNTPSVFFENLHSVVEAAYKSPVSDLTQPDFY